MITLNTLKEYITNFIDSNYSSVIYFSIGSYIPIDKVNKEINNLVNWKFEENQQFPPFIHDFKLKNYDTPILIILIDPNFDDELPYIVSSSNNFLENSWRVSDEFSNLYLSSMGINIIKISDYVFWGQNFILNPNNFNFEEFMIELCNKISNDIHNTLLFYHEFIGTNVMLFENLIKKNCYNFDSNKICIDITRGSDLSCYFNLSNPEFYPVIIQYETNKLKYINPDLPTNDEKSKIICEYKKFTNGFEENKEDCIFSKTKVNFLFQTPYQIILCFQIIKSDKIILNNIQNGIIPIIRYLYVTTNNENINLKMWGISHLEYIQSYIKNNNSLDNIFNKYLYDILDIIDNVIKNIKLIDDINSDLSCDELNNKQINDNTNIIKNTIIIDLFEIIKKILTNILIKYNIEETLIDNLIKNLENTNNKYEMCPIYKKFITSLNI
jgi:hypothetical protein